MDKKIMVIGLFLVGLLVISGCAQMSPRDNNIFEKTSRLAANSCDADDTCEINTADIHSAYIDISKIKVANLGMGNAGGAHTLSIDGETAIFRRQTRFRYLNGDGNAYACLDSYGTLYRSSTPCI
jgi:hypothetical protein